MGDGGVAFEHLVGLYALQTGLLLNIPHVQQKIEMLNIMRGHSKIM